MLEALTDYSAKRPVGHLHKRWPTEVEFESDDHELCLYNYGSWSKKSGKTHLDTCVEGEAEW